MIVVDTSALVAVVLGEPEAEEFLHVLVHHDIVVSAATLTEARIVLHVRQGLDALRDLDELLEECGAQIAPYDERDALTAHAAWARYGKGRHPAGLNLGDCMSYAMARRVQAPLLFKGDDFTRTDLEDARRTT